MVDVNIDIDNPSVEQKTVKKPGYWSKQYILPEGTYNRDFKFNVTVPEGKTYRATIEVHLQEEEEE